MTTPHATSKVLDALVQVVLPPFLLLILTGLLSIGTEIPVGNFTRDPAYLADIHPFFGFISNIGILFWCSATVICLMGWRLLRSKSEDQNLARFFLFSALFTGLLMFDDLFLFHEMVFPAYLGIGEKITVSCYGILLVGVLYHYQSVILKTPYQYLVIALGFFACSVGVDLIQDSLEALVGPWRILFEDGFKLLGIFAWFFYFWEGVYLQLKIKN